MRLFAEFAQKWRLPFTSHPGVDPRILIDRPFSRAPIVVGSGASVAAIEPEGPQPRMLKLEVDLSMPTESLLPPIAERINAARRRWRAEGGNVTKAHDRELERLRKMILVGRLRARGLTNDQVNEKLRPWGRRFSGQESVSRMYSELRQMLDSKSYADIVPHTDPSNWWNPLPPTSTPEP